MFSTKIEGNSDMVPVIMPNWFCRSMEDSNDEDDAWKEPVTGTSLQKRETDSERVTCMLIM